MGWLDNGDYCQRGEVPEWAIAALQAESIVSPLPGELRDYHYPNTMVAFVEGELDVANIENGKLYRDAITSETSWLVLPEVGHGVHRDPVGAATIQAKLTGSPPIPIPTPTAAPDEGPTPVIATIPVGDAPLAVRVNPTTNRIYVANQRDDTVSVIDGASNAVIVTIPVGDKAFAIGVNSVTNRVYVTNFEDATVSVIDGGSNTVIATVPVGDKPFAIQAIGVNSVTNRVYVTNIKDGTV